MNDLLSSTPTERTESWWQLRHQQKLAEKEELNNDIELLFLGDSITHGWESDGNQYWQQYFSYQKAFNLGFDGDRTEHILWRIQNGEIDHLSPKWIILLIGTNNAGHRLDQPNDIAIGVQSILDVLHQRLPTSKVLLMAIFPRSRNTNKPMRQRVDASNVLIKEFSDGRQVHWLDINSHFLTSKGVLLDSVMPDLLHLHPTQYNVWATAVSDYIKAHQ